MSEKIVQLNKKAYVHIEEKIWRFGWQSPSMKDAV